MPKTDIGFCIIKGIAYLLFSNYKLPNTNPNIPKKRHFAEYAFEPKELRKMINFISEQLDKYDPETQGKITDA